MLCTVYEVSVLEAFSFIFSKNSNPCFWECPSGYFVDIACRLTEAAVAADFRGVWGAEPPTYP